MISTINGKKELDEEQVARKATEQEGLDYKYGTMQRFEKELARLARKRTDVFDEFEESEAEGITKEDGVPADDGKAQNMEDHIGQAFEDDSERG